MSELITILCIGDSHTAGYPYFDPSFGGNPQSSYVYWLRCNLVKEYPMHIFEIENQGICGQLSRDIVNRFKSKINIKNYDFTILWAGANDLAIGYADDTVWKNLKRAIEISRSIKDMYFILITIPPMLDYISTNSAVKRLNKKITSKMYNKYIYIDAYRLLEKKGALSQIYDVGDGVHLSIEGYKVIGEAIFNKLSPYVQKLF